MNNCSEWVPFCGQSQEHNKPKVEENMLFPRKMMIVAVACALGATTLMTGCKEEAVSGPRQMPPAQVKVIALEGRDQVLSTQLNGRTSAYYVAEVRPQVSGILKKRLFKEGAEVKAGQPLYQIDPATYEAALQSAEATLAQAQADLVRARADAKRSSELVKVNAVSKQSDDAAQAALKTAEATVLAAKAAVTTAKINLDYTQVRSPISGRVSRSEVTEGALLSGYQAQMLTNVQQLDPIYVDVTQSAEELLRIKREIQAGTLKTDKEGNADITLQLADGSTYKHSGKLTFTDAQVESSTGMVKLRAVFPNPERDLLPGMYVRATLAEGVRPDAVLVHMQSVMRDERGNAYVYVVTPDNKVERRDIQVTRTEGTLWLVDKGLKSGERVIFEGFQRTAPGATVTPVEIKEGDLPAANPVF